MSYTLQHKGTTFYVECERHGYRTRLYLIEVVHSGAEPDGQGGFIPCEWNRHGYIGSWYPATKSGGYADSVSTFKAKGRTRKAVAQECLVNFMDSVLTRDWLEVRSW